MDISIASTLAPSYIQGSATTAGSSAGLRYEQKLSKYRNTEFHNDLFIPLVVESLGTWHTDAIPLLKRFAELIGDYQHMDHKLALRSLMTDLSICLQKANGRMLAERC